MSTTTRASIIIDATTQAAINEFEKLKKTLGGFGDVMNTIKGAAAALGGVLGVGAFAGWIKGAIDAADEMSDLSQRTGLAVKDISGLQIAFKMGGMGADALQGNMAKLNRGIVDGSAAFEAMGLSTRNADGSLKSTRQMLGEVSDKFATYQDGAAKSALAMDIFGKSGAEMIPMLNGGSQALDDFDALARKLGLTLDEDVVENAGKFNDTLDLLTMGTKGVASQVAAQLLPTLSGLSGQFLESMTSGDRLKSTADFLSSSLKVLYITGLGIVEAFKTVGTTLGGVSAAAVAALSGDFSGAVNILREMKTDIGTGWKTTLAEMQAAWDASGNASVEAMAKSQKALAPTTKAVEDAGKAAAKTTDEYEKLMQQIYGKASGTDPDFVKNLKLIETQGKKTGKTLEQIQEVQQAYINQQPYMTAALKERIQAAERANAQWDEDFKNEEELRKRNEAAIKGAREMAEQLEFEAKTLRLTNTEREIAIRLRQMEAAGLKAGSAEYEAMADRIRNAVVGRDLVQASIDSQNAIRDEWKKTSDQIGQSFINALMQGGKSVKEYLIGLFRTMVLQPVLAPVGTAVSGLLGAMMPGGSAMAGTGAASGGGLLSGLSNVGSMLGGFGTAAGYGAQALFAGNGLGALSGGFGMLGAGSISQGLGMIAGVAGPIVAGISMLSSLIKSMKTPGEQHTGGYYSSNGLEANMANALALTNGGGDGGYARDLIKRANPEIKTLVGATVDSVLKSTQAQAKALGFDISLGIDAGLAANTNGKGKNKNAFGYFNITSGGEVVSEYSNRELGSDFGQATAKFAADMAEAAAKVVLAGTDFQRAGETAVQTLQRLTAIQGMSEALNPLGGVFSAIANSSLAAREHLIDLAGGIDQLTAQATAFVKDYYSQDEQVGIQAKAITDALAATGLSADQLGQRGDYRSLVESLTNMEDPIQREQLAVLLKLAPSFSQLTDYLKQNNMTLGDAAAMAPDVPILQSMLDPQEKTAKAAESIFSGVQASNTLLGEIKGQLGAIAVASDKAAKAADAAVSAANAALERAGVSSPSISSDTEVTYA